MVTSDLSSIPESDISRAVSRMLAEIKRIMLDLRVYMMREQGRKLLLSNVKMLG